MDLKTYIKNLSIEVEAQKIKEEVMFQHEQQLRSRDIAAMKKHLRLATLGEYLSWLNVRYLEYGDKNFTYIDWSPRLWMAVSDLTIYPISGAGSLDIIVPKGVKFKAPNGLGHHKLYLHDGSTNPDYASVYIAPEFVKHL